METKSEQRIDGTAGTPAPANNTPCSACKLLRRKCKADCIFAPHFPPDNPDKFANVHKVFGASNVAKLLERVLPKQREDCANSLAYEADMRIRYPVHGCVGIIEALHQQLGSVQMELDRAKVELGRYVTCAGAPGIGLGGSGRMGDGVGRGRAGFGSHDQKLFAAAAAQREQQRHRAMVACDPQLANLQNYQAA